MNKRSLLACCLISIFSFQFVSGSFFFEENNIFSTTNPTTYYKLIDTIHLSPKNSRFFPKNKSWVFSKQEQAKAAVLLGKDLLASLEQDETAKEKAKTPSKEELLEQLRTLLATKEITAYEELAELYTSHYSSKHPYIIKPNVKTQDKESWDFSKEYTEENKKKLHGFLAPFAINKENITTFTINPKARTVYVGMTNGMVFSCKEPANIIDNKSITLIKEKISPSRAYKLGLQPINKIFLDSSKTVLFSLNESGVFSITNLESGENILNKQLYLQPLMCLPNKQKNKFTILTLPNSASASSEQHIFNICPISKEAALFLSVLKKISKKNKIILEKRSLSAKWCKEIKSVLSKKEQKKIDIIKK